MSNTPSALLLARRERAGRKPRAQEPADMGTSYGLECMLDQQLANRAPAPAAAPQRRSWLPRWLRARSRD